MKEKETKEEGKKEEKKDKSNNTSLFVVLAIALLIILICAIAIFYRYNSNDFKYAGIEFNKNYMGDITFYTAKIPVTNNQGVISGYKEVDFRNDPRKLKDVIVNTSGNIKFADAEWAYVSYGEMKQCGDNSLAAANLGVFMSITDTKYRGALDDSDYLGNPNIPYVNCQTHPDNTVILVKSGNETKIEQTAENCYELVFKECDILKVTEKFEVTILKQYMESINKK